MKNSNNIIWIFKKEKSIIFDFYRPIEFLQLMNHFIIILKTSNLLYLKL